MVVVVVVFTGCSSAGRVCVSRRRALSCVCVACDRVLCARVPCARVLCLVPCALLCACVVCGPTTEPGGGATADPRLCCVCAWCGGVSPSVLCATMIMTWRPGVLVCWCPGVLVSWCLGVLVCWGVLQTYLGYPITQCDPDSSS